MKGVLKRIGGYAAVPVYLIGMFLLGVAGLVLKAMEKRRQRKLAKEQGR